MPQLDVKITKHLVKLDPRAVVYHVEVEHPAQGVWMETLTSEREVSVFIRGLQCAASFTLRELSVGVTEENEGAPLVPKE